MSAPVIFLPDAVLGLAVGSLLVPLTRRELATSAVRAASPGEPLPGLDESRPPASRAQRIALAAVSGLLPAYVLYRVGWAPNAIPPLLLLVGLVQLAYCDLKRRLLPKTLVYALSLAVIGSGVVIAVCTSEWERLFHASLGGLISFMLFFIVNLINPRWLAFGDVRLSLVFGFGLAWVSPIDLFEAFLFANLLALFTGLVLIASRRAERTSALPWSWSPDTRPGQRSSRVR
jgi:leader peptidase (prepilin peptidase)/N-methyltransferase